jgi:hypothetical protein
MSSAPYGVRLLVGVAATAVEGTLKLPQTILMYPMTLASQLAHLVMKVQQDVADLVIKGDTTLESIFPPRDEQPPWATFDEDAEDAASVGAEVAEPKRTEGRFALFSASDISGNGSGPSMDVADPEPGAATPEIVIEIDYDDLTLAQLRARLQSLSVGELEDLLSYEEAGKSRAPFLTLLANRITRASTR